MIFKKKSLLAIAAMFLASMVFMIACSDPPPDGPVNPPQPGNEVVADLLGPEWIWSEESETGRWSYDVDGTGTLDELHTMEGKVNVPTLCLGANTGAPNWNPTGRANLILNLADAGENFITLNSGNKIRLTYKSSARLFFILEPKNPPEGNAGWTRWHAMLPAGTHSLTLDLSKIGGRWGADDWEMTEPDLSGYHFRIHEGDWVLDQPVIDIQNNLQAFYFELPSTESNWCTDIEITTFEIIQ